MDVQDGITEFWDTVAPAYETPENVAAPGTPGHRAWTAAIRSVLPDGPCEVLDVGTGTGFVARIAAGLGHVVTATDLSAGMLRTAVERTPDGQVTYAVGDAVDPDFPPDRFDVVINRSLLWTLREPDRALRNWHALLRPGGRAVVVYGLAGQAWSTDAEGTDLFARHYPPGVQAALPAMHLDDHEPLRRVATDAGFADVRVVALTDVRGWETSPGSDQPYALLAERR